MSEDTRTYISQVTLPNGSSYYLKDVGARELIAELHNITFHKCSSAADTPVGVKWMDGATEITGTLTATNANKSWFYLVPSAHTETGDVYDEYIAANEGTDADPSWAWEKLGNTDIEFSDLALLNQQITFSKGSGDSVLGADTTFTAGSSNVSYTNPTTVSFVKSYPGASSKLETASIKGVGSDITFNAVDGTPGTVTATNTVLGTATSASKIETESKTATSVTFGTSTTASKATDGTPVDVAKAGTAVSASDLGNATQVITTATYANEVLTFGKVDVTARSITPAVSNGTITPHTFSNVTVPVISAHEDVSISSVKTNTAVEVPVISSNNAVTASGEVSVVSKTAATAASSATTVATGSLKADDTVGATVMTGLGTAVTDDAITGLGTFTAAAQTISVGTNDQVSVAAYGDLGLTVDPNAKVIKRS